MADTTALRHSPLAHLHSRFAEASSADVAVREVAYTGMVSLRVDPWSPGARSVADVLGVAVPERCGEVSGTSRHRVLWLGPDEFLVITSADPSVLAVALGEALEAHPGLAVDVSANRTVIELIGPQARAVLEKGCPVDLHPRSFGPGTAVATTVGRVPLVLWQTGPVTYRLLPRSSFADHAARWILDAMREFGGESASESVFPLRDL
jgi:sarcosine oxidase, subunit gamma